MRQETSSRSKLRRQIAWEAGRLMYFREETEYYRAKMRAARVAHKGWVHPGDLPSNAEIRDEIELHARMYEGESRTSNLRQMRLEAFWMMTKLERFEPKLIGSVLTGHVRHGSDIDIHVFADAIDSVTNALDQDYLLYDVERKQIRKDGEARTYTHVHVRDRFRFELTVYPRSKATFVSTCSITGKPIERASIAQLRQRLEADEPGIDLDEELQRLDEQPDRFQVYEALLLPLENVKQDPRYHPEGDVQYHSLQVFERALDTSPYDEEFLTAALLHDVGKGIDPANHVAAGLEALGDLITERTRWLIEHHMEAQAVKNGSGGARLRRRLEAHESWDDLLELVRCDREGRRSGATTRSLEEAIEYLRDLSNAFPDR